MFTTSLFADLVETLTSIGIGIGAVFLFLIILVAIFSRFYVKVGPERAVIRTGFGGLKEAVGKGMIVIPVFHKKEFMDMSVKRIEIKRLGEDGLVCRDNIRADIEVAFYVRVSEGGVKDVAKKLGAARASDRQALIELFDAQFSEALKTIGKQFDFVELYTERDRFKDEIMNIIGTDTEDLQGYEMVSVAIDYLEQTPLEMLNPNNILDAEGIKKITDLTSREAIRSNDIEREKEKAITKQDVEAREAILALERQQVEAEERQKREIVEVTAREVAQGQVIEQEELLRSENARLATEEEVAVREENKQRQIIVAAKNKERTDAVETERVERDRGLEATERERVVSLADINKDKEIEVEKRNIQEVIRERVIVERTVVEEQENIRDVEEFKRADRDKRVAITNAERDAEEALVKDVKAAEAEKKAAIFTADQVITIAEADRQKAEKETQATKMLAEAKQADVAADGLAEAQVQEAKATALEKEGFAEAAVVQRTAEAEAKGLEAKAVGVEKHGTAEAEVMRLKYSSEANGIEEKAGAMKLFDAVGKDHEEFKLRLNKDLEIEKAAIDAQRQIAEAQSNIVGEALKSARIDIVGGETTFFDKIVDSVKGGKAVDRFVYNSQVATDIKDTFFNGDPEYFQARITELTDTFNLSTDDVKDLSIAALIAKMLGLTSNNSMREELQRMLGLAHTSGVADNKASSVIRTVTAASAPTKPATDESSDV